MENLLTIKDLSLADIKELLMITEKLKQEKDRELYLKGKSLGMIFAKSSTRTRVSFETGIYQLGGQGIFLSSQDIQLGRGESIADTAKVLSRYIDGVMIRTFDQHEVEKLATASSIPIINGLTDKYHPCQALADLFTIKEKKGKLNELKLAYVGDGNNMAHSLLLAATKVGMDIAVATPQDYAPQNEVVKIAKRFAQQNGSQVELLTDVKEAAKSADVIYTDVWASMGDEDEAEERKLKFADYQVNQEIMDLANEEVIFMHCLPAHRGEEVTADVIDSRQSVVFDQAENRLHLQKGVMVKLMA
ncbi:ornithine carbamoyltransferase [Halobacteroides halobius DSM 5150]|uniref:Ornithine carbamoyltransferase n=1 Tax=Halobacteroides halobius (strain ATCC 35273 / DSM 5150 / MD-1) TaxID=748449 RepID=L0K6B8_HALHC|nr:ornithine carbamoyltransferase [Halobacteroides halobius]AGB40787.1 ornithine carbamoyltransferase [Halobacteroides halobius DSM 5150]